MLIGQKEGLKMNFNISDKQVKHLLNGTEVVVFSGKFVFNTIVEWHLADHLEDAPPFLEVLFVDRCTEEAILCVSNLDQVVYDLEGVLIIFDKGCNDEFEGESNE